jgi:hypothetical protein
MQSLGRTPGSTTEGAVIIVPFPLFGSARGECTPGRYQDRGGKTGIVDRAFLALIAIVSLLSWVRALTGSGRAAI